MGHETKKETKKETKTNSELIRDLYKKISDTQEKMKSHIVLFFNARVQFWGVFSRPKIVLEALF